MLGVLERSAFCIGVFVSLLDGYMINCFFFFSSLVLRWFGWSGSLVKEEDPNVISFFLSRAGAAHAVYLKARRSR